MQDVRYAIRALALRPWFTAAVIVTLAAGIGINTAVFSLANSVVLEPLPFADGERLVTIASARLSDAGSRMNVSLPDFQDLRSSTSSFDALEAAVVVESVLTETHVPPERVRTARVTSGLLSLTGVAPLLGRSFQPTDDVPGAPAVVVLSHELWSNRYAATPDVLGRFVRVDGRPATIVGVMPPGVQFPNREQMWTGLAPNDEERTSRDLRIALVVGKLKPTVTRERASTEVETVAARISEAHPATSQGIGARVLTFNERFNGGEVRIAFLLMLGAVGLVLVVVCANVANMMLSFTLGRRREMAIRTALGASRWRIVRQVLTECLVLSAAGGVLAVGLAMAGIRLFDGAVRDVGKPSWITFGLDYGALAFCATLSFIAALIFGLAPAVRVSRAGAAGTLKAGGRSGSAHGGRLSAGLVACQFALAVVLLAGAGLLVRSFVVSEQRTAWVAGEQVLTARVNLPVERYPDRPARERFFERMRQTVQALPGTAGVALASHLPGQGSGGVRIELEGRLVQNPAGRETTWQVSASPGYLATIGLPLERGRDLDDRDGLEGRDGALVTREFAERFWPGSDPIGRRFRFNAEDTPGPWHTVVGVTASMAHGSNGVSSDPAVFLPLRQADASSLVLFVRADDPVRLSDPLRSLVQELDPELPLSQVERLDARLAESRWAWAVFGTAFSIFGAAALLLAGVGLYAVMSQTTARRTREIGIRVALGATPRQVVQTVMSRGIVQVGAGLAAGLALAWFATGAMQALLYGVSPHDPLVLTMSVSMLVAVALVACGLPAYRATIVPPMKALNADE